MSDPISAVVVFLEDRVSISEVFGHELPKAAVEAMPRAVLVVSGSGGIGSRGYLELDRQRVDVRSYGETHAAAMDAAIEAQVALKQMRRTVVVYGDPPARVLLHSADPAGGFIPLREPLTDWPLVLRSYNVLYDERTVPA